MADKMRYRWGPKAEVFFKKTGTVAIAMGDLLRIAQGSGRVYAVTASTDATCLIGVAMSASPAADPTATVVKVYLSGFGTVFEFDLVNAGNNRKKAFKAGQAFCMTSAQPQQLTMYKTTASFNPFLTASNVVARCAQEMDASGSVVKVWLLSNKWTGRPVIPGGTVTASRVM